MEGTRSTPREITYLAPQQVNQLEEACLIPEDKLLVRLLYQTGARISEVLALKPRNIDYAQQRLELPALKRKDISTKLVIVDGNTLDRLRSYCRGKPADKPLFSICRQQAYYRVRIAAKRTGLGKAPCTTGQPSRELGPEWRQPQPFAEAVGAPVIQHNGKPVPHILLRRCQERI